MDEQMLVGTGGGGGEGCFGLGESGNRGPLVGLNGDQAIPIGIRVQLCIVGYGLDQPIDVTVEGPAGFVRRFQLILRDRPIIRSGTPRLDGILYGPQPSGPIEVGRYDSEIFATDFALVSDRRSSDASLGAYTVRARQGLISSATPARLVEHLPPTGVGPEVLVAGGLVAISVVGPADGVVEIGAYEDVDGAQRVGSKFAVRRLQTLSPVTLDEQGVGSVVLRRADLPPGPFCVLARVTANCLSGNRVNRVSP